jgi:cell wall-associated protease
MVLLIIIGTLAIPIYAKTLTAKADSAISVSSGVPLTSEIGPNGSNEYQFTTNREGQAFITIQKMTAGLILTLYDANGNIVDERSNQNGGGYLLINTDLQQGTYTIKVTPYFWNNGVSSATYQLEATYPGSFSRNSSTFEPNETFETAMSISDGKFYNSSSNSVIDQDVYRFTTNQDGEVYVTLDNITAGYQMDIYDAYGNLIVTRNTSSAGSWIAEDQMLKKGTYYVFIVPYNWVGKTTATYRIKAVFPGSFTRDPSTFEPNDTLQTAMSVISNKVYSSKSTSVLDCLHNF